MCGEAHYWVVMAMPGSIGTPISQLQLLMIFVMTLCDWCYKHVLNRMKM